MADHTLELRSGSRPRVDGPAARALAIGFATAAAMWVVGYLSMMRPGLIVGEALFALTLACALVGGVVAGRRRRAGEAGWVAAIAAALVTATLNMLLIGSLLGRDSPNMLAQFALWTAGNYGATLALGAIGGAIGGSRRTSAEPPPINWFSVFTRVVAAAVFLLLITGGLVTGLEAGLAVPDWPNSFGHNMLLYPLAEMKAGVYYEHAHRLYGMLVGVSAITLAVSLFFFDRRGPLRALGIAFLVMVCVQGYMGGARVYLTSVPLAIVHGVFGQIVFATACAIAAFTSATWLSDRAPEARSSAATDRTWTLALVIMLVLQLALGAMYRHLQHDHVLYTHILMAAFVTAAVVFAGGRAWGKYADMPVLPRVGKSLLHTVGLQIVLGVLAMIAVWSRPGAATPATADAATPIEHIPVWETVITTAHQATGALLLALATLLMLWTGRLLK